MPSNAKHKTRICMCVRGGRRESVRKLKIGRGGKERRERNGRERGRDGLLPRV